MWKDGCAIKDIWEQKNRKEHWVSVSWGMKEAGVAMLMINDTMSPTPYGAVFPHTWWSPLRGWVITPIYNFRENIYACLSLPFLHRTGLQTLDLLGLGMVVVPEGDHLNWWLLRVLPQPGTGFTALLSSPSAWSPSVIPTALGHSAGTLLMPTEYIVALFLSKIQRGRGTILIVQLLKNS